jgi:hypothetical protein
MTEEHRQPSGIVFGDLWAGSQDLLASIAIVGAMLLEREDSNAQVIAATERAFDHAMQLTLVFHETIGRLNQGRDGARRES